MKCILCHQSIKYKHSTKMQCCGRWIHTCCVADDILLGKGIHDVTGTKEINKYCKLCNNILPHSVILYFKIKSAKLRSSNNENTIHYYQNIKKLRKKINLYSAYILFRWEVDNVLGHDENNKPVEDKRTLKKQYKK